LKERLIVLKILYFLLFSLLLNFILDIIRRARPFDIPNKVKTFHNAGGHLGTQLKIYFKRKPHMTRKILEIKY